MIAQKDAAQRRERIGRRIVEDPEDRLAVDRGEVEHVRFDLGIEIELGRNRVEP
jgi:hypothetical protein